MPTGRVHGVKRTQAKNLFDFIAEADLPDEVKKVLLQASVAKVEISNAKKMWRIHLTLPEIVETKHLKVLEQLIAREIPQLSKVEFAISFNLPVRDLKSLMQQYWSPMVEEITDRHPILNGWLREARWEVDDDLLRIFVGGQVGLEICEQKKIGYTIAANILKKFGLEVKVSLELDNDADPLPQDWLEEEETLKARFREQIKILAFAEKNEKMSGDNEKKPAASGEILFGKAIRGEPIPIKDIQDEEKNVVIVGRVFNLETRELRSGRRLVTFDITDLTDSITVKCFEDEKSGQFLGDVLKKNMWVKLQGTVQYDRYSHELILLVRDVNKAEAVVRMDNAEEKRVELHLHTKMSAMDGLTDVKDLVTRLGEWGHAAVAITDHGVVQAFPEAYEAAQKSNVKIIYGIEAYLIEDGAPIIINPREEAVKDATYVVFDLETTGFSPVTDEIIEIGAVKIHGNKILDRFSAFVCPVREIPPEVQELTGITNNMVSDAPPIAEVLPKFIDFVGDAVLVAHNAQFDTGFLRANMEKILNRTLAQPVLDTLGLARGLFPDMKNHKLKTLAKEFNVKLESHHRAVDDAEATAQLLIKFLERLVEHNIDTLGQINSLIGNINIDQLRSHHVIILVKNQQGLKNLYQLVTDSHLKYYHRHPRIPKSELIKKREGLIIGSACEAGELFRALLDNAPQERLEEIAGFYDYLEIQPVGNNEFLLREGRVNSYDELRELNRKIFELGRKIGRPVVATGDVHFLDPEDAVYRAVLLAGKGFEDADNQAPLYLKTTEEMLEEFSYLGLENAREVVIENPVRIAESIDSIKPMPDDFFPPKIEGAEEQIIELTISTAKKIYGDPLPDIVQQRVDKELNSIITNGFAVLYLIAHKLVKKSNEDGYLVGSRGSVGSSFVATMTGITEVNPLPPHYVCRNCKYSEFVTDGSYGSGADMPDKDCPVCGKPLKKDGHDIPFEVFLGFKGDKVPDIDLNFSGEYQPRAHKFTEELFGKGYVFRAGTTGTIADKTAFGFVKNYLEERKIIKRNAEITRLASGCTGVKRTTGQHPGGVMVVPRDMDVHDFTPLQFPADDKTSGVITTHFDYHSISGRIVKLDILGHDDPTVIKMLEDLTGVDAKTIPLDEPRVLQLFSGTESLGVTPDDIRSNVGTYGIPEFGTKFVRQMLEDTRPKTFSELVRISGFSHGTDVWLNNAQDLIRSGTCTLSEAISTRDDIMVYLIYKGLEPSRAFKIMEGVRKGKGVKPEDEEYMRENNVPEWYIDSCKKIKYMFPKAHAVAYVMMAFRIAYFKVYYPEAFYATYFTVRADEFDADIICRGKEAVLNKIREIENKGNEASAKEKNLLTILEVALEMYVRGIKIRPVSLVESTATRFLITEDGLLPPFAALQGVGEAAARSIERARDEAKFTSIEDLRTRARISKTVVEVLQNHGCLRNLPETDQLALF
ncbi:DNA polymerase III subunit alpha [Thermincola ferriacetica]|uniref:DNA polymerase III PolC-type n=1 Tax=Thermincola ferriacetica TaxID=281456 RepID=A0A0L6W6U8_9FIRM|nr:PolC-type DNA polymerase III [Thermincola ferriacetica]KNZ71245.1 DNA polymerase III subunit alpha [Thermincola ferriacetica]